MTKEDERLLQDIQRFYNTVIEELPANIAGECVFPVVCVWARARVCACVLGVVGGVVVVEVCAVIEELPASIAGGCRGGVGVPAWREGVGW